MKAKRVFVRGSSKVTMLVVDDYGEFDGFFRRDFLDVDLQVIFTRSYTSARSWLEDSPAIDILLVDQSFCEEHGYGLLSTLNENSDHHVQTIIVGVSEDEGFIRRCFELGVCDYIVRPVNLLHLRLKIESLMENIVLHKGIVQQKIQLEKWLHYSEREKDVTRFIFDHLLKNNYETLPGVTSYIRPCTALSGDFSVCKKSPSGNIFCILADATGHGLSSAVTIMPVATVFGAMVTKGFSLPQILVEINRKLERETPMDRFVAAIAIEIDHSRRELNIWNGGMPKAYWVSGNGEITNSFSSVHMALGILADDQFDVSLTVLPLPDEGFFFACSDGVLEQKNSAGNSYAMESLHALLTTVDAENIVDRLMLDLRTHVGHECFNDDISVCVIDAQVTSQGSIEDNRFELRCLADVDPFTWELKISGSHLMRQQIPPLANQYLQGADVPLGLCKKAFIVIAELVSNAVDHGVLKLKSSIKAEEDGFLRYLELRQEGLRQLSENDFVKLKIKLLKTVWGCVLEIEVSDSGEGYQPQMLWSSEKSVFSGRGLGLVSSIFDELDVLPPGNVARAKLNVFKEPLHG